MHKPKLIIADDDATVIGLIKEAAEAVGYEVSTAANGRQLLKTTEETYPDVIILDLVMPDMDGIETLSELASNKCSAAIILITGFQKGYLDSANMIGTAKGLNIAGSLSKPFSLDTLTSLLQATYSPS